MAVRKNADGSITVGILKDEPKPVAEEKPKEDKPKRTKKTKGESA